MSRKKTPALNCEGIGKQISHWSSDAGLAVTVISTTEDGTIAALKAAGNLAADLDASTTLLNLEIVPARFPLYRPPVSLKYTIHQQRSMLRRSGASEADVDLKIRYCRDWSSGLQRLLRRRSLIVIGGKRLWWLSREERLERVLRALGHHVIFIDVTREKVGTPRRNPFLPSFGRIDRHLHNSKDKTGFILGARTHKESIF